MASNSFDGLIDDDIPLLTWDQAAADLIQNAGVATIHLPLSLAKIHAKSFHIATRALDVASSSDTGKVTTSVDGDGGRTDGVTANGAQFPVIPSNANSADATGYHSAGIHISGNSSSSGNGNGNSLSRYNAYREGFVFSNGDMFDMALSQSGDGSDEETESFEQGMNTLFESMYGLIACNVLKAIERKLELNQDADIGNKDVSTSTSWFQSSFGPMDRSSQWHVKRYVQPSEEKGGVIKEEKKDDDVLEWLPCHTDPSLISVIIHDAPDIQTNAMGLQYQQSLPSDSTDDLSNEDSSKGSKKKVLVWNNVQSHGHAVATIFTGSVLSYITGGLFPSAKHRVIWDKASPSMNTSQRQAATLFVRPRGDTILTVPPSMILNERSVKIRKNVKFQDWLARVSRNYMKKGKAKKGTAQVKPDSQKSQSNQGGIIDEDPGPLFWADEYTELTLHTTTGQALSGKEKFLGGEYCEANGHIYTIPGFAKRVVDIDVTVEPPILKEIGPIFPGEFKWLRGIPIGNIVYGIPCHHAGVLKINCLTNEVEVLMWDENIEGAPSHDLKWKYHGAAVSPFDGCIYCIPQAAERVLKIDPATDELGFIGPSFPGKNKWYGGLLSKIDGAIYGICQNAKGILRIDPERQDCTIHGDFPEGLHKWHGGVIHSNGCIYCIPDNTDTVLKITPGLEPRLSLIGANIKSGEHRIDGKYKFLGGASAGNKVYFFPSDADRVAEINTDTDEIRDVGPNLRDLEVMRNNKWQNGFTAIDGTVYAIPLKGETVLRIRPNDAGDPDVTVIGGPYRKLNKWEGGVCTPSGDMYCMPLNHNWSLRIRPILK